MIYRSWLGQNKPPLGVRPIPGHPLAQGLVGCWLLNKGSGDLANDSVDRNIGILTGGATRSVTQQGPAVNFAADAQHVKVLRHPSIEPPTNVTVAVLARITTFADYQDYLVSYIKTGTGDNDSWAIYGNLGGQFYYDSGGTAYRSPASTVNLADGKWHWIVGVLDASYVRLYVDGLEQGSGTVRGGNISYSGTGALYLGDYNGTDYGTLADLAVVYIWSRGLTASEVVTVSAQPFSMFGTPDLATMYYSIPAAGITVPVFEQYYRRLRVA